MEIIKLFRLSISSYFIFFICFDFPLYANLQKSGQQNSFLINKELTIDYFNNISDGEYILGAGDALEIDISNIFKNKVLIDGEGTIFLPRIGRIYVKGLSLIELNNLINEKFSKYLKFPDIQIRIIKYRPVIFYVDGEVNNPGLHSLEGAELAIKHRATYFPTLIDAIKESGGFTRSADFSNVEIIRKNSISNGGGKIKTTINFKKILKGDMSQNIRIYDSDSLLIKKAKTINDENLKLAFKSNIYPDTISIYVNGRDNKGKLEVPYRTSLNQALLMAGGKNLLSGKIVHISFNSDGTYESNKFSYAPKIKPGSPKNPILKDKDIVFLNDGNFRKTAEFIELITRPFAGIVSSYGLYRALGD